MLKINEALSEILLVWNGYWDDFLALSHHGKKAFISYDKSLEDLYYTLYRYAEVNLSFDICLCTIIFEYPSPDINIFEPGRSKIRYQTNLIPDERTKHSFALLSPGIFHGSGVAEWARNAKSLPH